MPELPEIPEETPEETLEVPEAPEAPEVKPEISVTPEDTNNKKEPSNNETSKNEEKIPATGNVVSSYVVLLTSLSLVALGLVLSKRKITRFK